MSEKKKKIEIKRTTFASPRATTPPFLRPRSTPSRRHTAILVAEKRSMELCDVLIGHDEHLEKKFGFYFFRVRGGQGIGSEEEKRTTPILIFTCTCSLFCRTLKPAGKPGRDAATPRSFPAVVMGGKSSRKGREPERQIHVDDGDGDGGRRRGRRRSERRRRRDVASSATWPGPSFLPCDCSVEAEDVEMMSASGEGVGSGAERSGEEDTRG